MISETLQTFRIALNPITFPPNSRKVEGFKVEIPGFEEFQFFARQEYHSWIITEVTTGRMVMEGDSLDDVLVFVISKLIGIGKEEFTKKLAAEPKMPDV